MPYGLGLAKIRERLGDLGGGSDRIWKDFHILDCDQKILLLTRD